MSLKSAVNAQSVSPFCRCACVDSDHTTCRPDLNVIEIDALRFQAATAGSNLPVSPKGLFAGTEPPGPCLEPRVGDTLVRSITTGTYIAVPESDQRSGRANCAGVRGATIVRSGACNEQVSSNYQNGCDAKGGCRTPDPNNPAILWR